MRFRWGDLEAWRLFNADIGEATHYPEPETLNQQAKLWNLELEPQSQIPES